MRRILPLLFLLAAGTPASALEVLNTADIEKVAGLSGVHTMPGDPRKGAGDDLNFAGPDGKLLVMVRLYEGRSYGALKKTYFAGDVSGVGDEAFLAPPGVKEPYVLCLGKGTRAASVTTFLQRTGKPGRTRGQLAALGRVVASRL